MKKIVIVCICICSVMLGVAQTYNPEEAARYAKRWCNDRNTKQADAAEWGGPYFKYDLFGGDCANFVSQCLIFGGLSLWAGTDGRGGYVKTEGVISGAQELVTHLEKYQNVAPPDTRVGFSNPPQEHDVGDPAFVIGSDGIAAHSLICSALDNSAQWLYSAHTADFCDSDFSRRYTRTKIKFFHFRNAFPAHCNNCVQDADETSIDCGGSCPPCQHATQQKVYTYATASSPLPAQTYAIENITAKGNVTIYSGNVEFYTAGNIDLLPGFEVKKNASFTGAIKSKRADVMADCGPLCTSVIPNICTPCPADGANDVWMLTGANIDHIDLTVTQWITKTQEKKAYKATIYPDSDGEILLWDFIAGTPDFSEMGCYNKVNDNLGIFYFATIITIVGCRGEVKKEQITLMVYNCISKKRMGLSDELSVVDTQTGDTTALGGESFSLKNSRMPVEPTEWAVSANVSESDSYFQIFPNPNNGTFSIHTTEPLHVLSDLTLTNQQGQIVYQQKHIESTTIALPILADGEYLLSLMIRDKRTNRKIIIHR